MAQKNQAQEDRREGQEGSRWYNKRPTGEEIGKWFAENVDIDEKLEHRNYVSGIVMIPGTEKSKEVVAWTPENLPVIAERSNLTYTPYAKVETRVKYFHDLMRAHAEEWQGVIEPISPSQPDPTLPPGFFYFLVRSSETMVSRFICCSMKVTVFKAGTMDYERRTVDKRTGEQELVAVGDVVLDAPPATKMVAVKTNYVDNFSLMKAETGAVGRALGLAGMLVIPGTGVATAEDMAEAESLEGRSAAEESTTAVAPPAQTQQATPAPDVLETLRREAVAAIGALREASAPAFAEFQKWAAGRGIGKVSEIDDQVILRGLATKAQNDLTAIKQDAAAAAAEAEGK